MTKPRSLVILTPLTFRLDKTNKIDPKKDKWKVLPLDSLHETDFDQLQYGRMEETTCLTAVPLKNTREFTRLQSQSQHPIVFSSSRFKSSASIHNNKRRPGPRLPN